MAKYIAGEGCVILRNAEGTRMIVEEGDVGFWQARGWDPDETAAEEAPKKKGKGGGKKGGRKKKEPEGDAEGGEQPGAGASDAEE